MALLLPPQVFTLIAHLVEQRTGLHYDLSDREVLSEKLSDRANELGLGSLLDYYYFLRYDEAGAVEFGKLVEALVVQETYFFREVDPLRVIVQHVIPDLLREQGQIRIWSAACATGEEPYTLVMMLDDAGLTDRVEVVASDISERALDRAKQGLYGGRALRSLPPQSRPQHLEVESSGRVRVREHLRRLVSWHRVNLVDRDAVRALGPFHVILCRNALIYFADDTIARVVDHLGEALHPNGLLTVGASESLLRFGTLFVCEERDGAFFYRKQSQ